MVSGEDRGQRLINACEAAIVRRIYAEYADDKGSLAIVKDLNRQGEPGPSGGKDKPVANGNFSLNESRPELAARAFF